MISVTTPPASATMRAPAAWSQIFSTVIGSRGQAKIDIGFAAGDDGIFRLAVHPEGAAVIPNRAATAAESPCALCPDSTDSQNRMSGRRRED